MPGSLQSCGKQVLEPKPHEIANSPTTPVFKRWLTAVCVFFLLDIKPLGVTKANQPTNKQLDKWLLHGSPKKPAFPCML
jgi:hypothetical protein